MTNFDNTVESKTATNSSAPPRILILSQLIDVTAVQNITIF